MKPVTLAFCLKMRCPAEVRGATGRCVDLAPDEEGKRYEGSCQSCCGKVGNDLRGQNGGLSCRICSSPHEDSSPGASQAQRRHTSKHAHGCFPPQMSAGQ